MSKKNFGVSIKTDVVLVGAGIMSATLGALISLLEPTWSIIMVERLDGIGSESSDPWNNAGTGHSALCELNYTPELPNGSIDISKAVKINEQFQISRQFWAYLSQNNILRNVREFLNPIPHVSFAHGISNVDYLKRRREALIVNPLFADMEFINNNDEISTRLPFMTYGRNSSNFLGLNWSQNGTDVDFGSLSNQLIEFTTYSGMETLFGQEVFDLNQELNGTWTVKTINRRNKLKKCLNAKFIFIGAGGGSLTLLQKSKIPEIKGFGGFPVGGAFLITKNQKIISKHRAKVYGLPPFGSPPMSAPHLDARIVNGKPSLLFGPFASWSPRFLKHGKATDLISSVSLDNIMSMLGVGLNEISLVGYLLKQLTLNENSRMAALQEFAPSASKTDWNLYTAGQRVQIICRKGKSGKLEFGTTIVSSSDGTIAGLLGASPGASTAVHAMLGVLERCFSHNYQNWIPKLKEIIPSLGISLSKEPKLFQDIWKWGTKSLKLETF